MAPEGQAIGRAQKEGPAAPDTRVVFVSYGAPGDLAEVEVVSSKPGFSQARLTRLIEPGPCRVEPRCPLHFRPGSSGPACGGCDWQHLGYEAQLEAKRSIVADCLARIAKLPGFPVAPTAPSPAQWRYRNKVQVPFGLTRAAPARIAAGFYSPASHDIVDFDDCLVQPELSVRIALKVKQLAAGFRWRVYDEGRGAGWLRHLFVRTNSAGQALVALVTRTPELPQARDYVAAMRAAFPEIVSLAQNLQPLKTSVILGPRWRVLWGGPKIEEKVGRLTLRSSPGAFLQVNTPACEVLYAKVAEEISEGGMAPDLLADLYCGVGSIALWAAGTAKRVLGVEESREAVADAWENARLNGVKNVRFAAGRAETLLGRLRAEFGRAAPLSTVAVVDPPRSGCAVAVLKALAAPAVGRIVYVSCNPATFARDAAGLAKAGFRVASVGPVDLFPQTSHVELVARLDRRGRDSI